MKIAIINGPNLNLLGKRETSVYGDNTFEAYLETLKKEFPAITFSYFQSNIEGALIEQLQKEGFEVDGILLNAAAYTHTSVGLHDAIRAIPAPVVEIHISNTFSREDFRHQSYISGVAKGLIVGFGLESYRLGVLSFLNAN
jgi:3-dehydroquinate dehydratase-2